MNWFLSSALFFVWCLFCLLNYLIFSMILTDNYWLKKRIKQMKVRLRNILFRVFILLGPISFVLIILVIFVFGAYLCGRIVYHWLIDIDNENITEF